ncbi:MAG: rhomboid family intramembrane serine protease [Methanothrix sp.]|nr:rhomboid family intramembrane serine protease [Methanothrix sp.]
MKPFQTMTARREDNRYRDEWGESQKPVYGWRGRIPSGLPITYSGLILLACIVVFFISVIFPAFVYNYLALNPDHVMQRPWTLITHMFVHADFNHLFWNMLFLFFFGMELERRVGENKFLQIYMFSGIVAAFGQMMISSGSMVGASGALYGVMGCLAMIAPEIRILLFFVIPVSIRGAVVLFVLIDFLTLGSADNIAHMAHIVGLLVGLTYGQAMMRTSKY